MIFELVQKNLTIWGAGKEQSIRTFHGKLFIGCLLLGSNVIIHLKYLFGEENTPRGYIESIFMSSIAVMSFWCYSSMILKKEQLFKLINECEELLVPCKESKYSFVPNRMKSFQLFF